MNADEIEKLSSGVAKEPKGRVTLQDIEDSIASVHYFVLSDAVAALGETAPIGEFERLAPSAQYQARDLYEMIYHATESLRRTTVCVIVLKNGWHVMDSTTPLSPTNYDPVVGRKLAYDLAFKKLWPLLAFARKERAFQERQDQESR